eukprot:SAG11_NODE_2649_length_3126_cov_9.746614_6_plen_167_part_01
MLSVGAPPQVIAASMELAWALSKQGEHAAALGRLAAIRAYAPPGVRDRRHFERTVLLEESRVWPHSWLSLRIVFSVPLYNSFSLQCQRNASQSTTEAITSAHAEPPSRSGPPGVAVRGPAGEQLGGLGEGAGAAGGTQPRPPATPSSPRPTAPRDSRPGRSAAQPRR